MHKDIIILGDIHGDYTVIYRFFKSHSLEDVALFQVGDFGVGFNIGHSRDANKERKTLGLLSDYLGKRNSHLYVLRGNHDNPSYFTGQHNFDNITFLQDYKTVEVNNLVFLPIGGAISIDKIVRKENVSWWPDEKVVYKELTLNSISGVDVVLTHTAPNFAPPFGSNTLVDDFCDRTQGLWIELLEERNNLAKIADKILERSHPQYWFYGHFHNSFVSEYEDMKMQCLNINEFYEPKFV